MKNVKLTAIKRSHKGKEAKQGGKQEVTTYSADKNFAREKL